MIGRRGREERAAFGRLVLGQATLLVLLATAAGTAIIPSDFGHFLELDGKDGRSCTKPCWRTPSSMNNCSPSIAIWRRDAARRAARSAAARCIRRTTAASLAADRRRSAKSARPQGLSGGDRHLDCG